MEDAARRLLAATFEGVAEMYDRARPGYAAAAIDWALPAGAHRVLDLAAGTGKLTADLVERGLDVVAVDPSPAMLARLQDRLPGVDARIGTAESIDLPDASLDAILIGSALHWFDRPAADFEMARVLRPGGVVATLGNSREHDVGWVSAFDKILERAASATIRQDLRSGTSRLEPAVFGPPDVRAFAFGQTLTPEQLVELAASRSYVVALPDEVRATVLDQVHELTVNDPQLRGREQFELPYRTVVARSVQMLRS